MKKSGAFARLAAIGGRLRTAPGRKLLFLGAFFRTWRLLFPIAAAYRRWMLRRVRIIAVVGSFGKTTAARAVHAGLGLPRGQPQGWNSGAHLALELLRIRPGQSHGVLEVGISRKGTMARCARMIRPDIVVVTSIGSEHHQALGTLEETSGEKAEMVRVLPAGGLAVINGDDPHALRMRAATRARVITFGFGDSCEVRASSLLMDIRAGMSFTLHARRQAQAMSCGLVGKHMVYAILAAVTVVVGEGLPLAAALDRLRRLEPAPERLEVRTIGDGVFLLLDTYKSILETITASLDALAAFQADRKIVVLGDIEEPAGPQGPLYRNLGAHLARIASRVVFVGGNKAYQSVAVGARAAGLPRERIVYAGRSPKRAADLVREDLRQGDIVLIKGRSTQQLERVALHLSGRPVSCEVETCSLRQGCASCPLVKRLPSDPGRDQ